MNGLTERQRQVLDLIKASVEQRGYPPTLRELGLSMGIKSSNGVGDHVRALTRKGYLKVDSWKGRGLRLVGVRWVAVPVDEEASR